MAWPSMGGLEAWLTTDRLTTGGWIVAAWILALVLLRVSDRFFDRVDDSLTQYNVPERKLNQVDTITDALIVSLALLATLYLLGVGEALWGAIALTSISGVVVGLAAQRFGENLIAGAVILFERPFQVGDNVEVDGQTGSVEAVTLHSTTLRTLDGVRVTMPNQRVLDGAITNFSASRQRRVSLTVDVEAPRERIDEARFAIHQAVQGEEHLVEDRETRIFVTQPLDGGVRFSIDYWVEADAYEDHCRPNALRRVLDALEEEGFTTA